MKPGMFLGKNNLNNLALTLFPILKIFIYHTGLCQVSVWAKISTLGLKDCFSQKNQDYWIKIIISFNNADLQNCSLVHWRIDLGRGGRFKAILHVSKIKTEAG